MQDELSPDAAEPILRSGLSWTAPVLLLLVLGLGVILAGWRRDGAAHRAKEAEWQQREAGLAAEAAAAREEIASLKKAVVEREQALAQREASIAGREDAASERVQSSFQGLLIQQNLVKDLEALKAAIPDLTPEMERLAKEHAQMKAERERLQKENDELRRRLRFAAPPEAR